MRYILSFLYIFLWEIPFASADNCAIIKDSYQRDSCYVSEASKYQNAAICAKVESPPFKDICKQSTEGAVSKATIDGRDPQKCMKMNGLKLRNCITLMAIQKKDFRLCKRLSDPEYQGTCYSGVAEKTNDTVPCKYSPTLTSQYGCLTQVVSQTKDPKKCQESQAIVKGSTKMTSDNTAANLLEALKFACKQIGAEIK